MKISIKNLVEFTGLGTIVLYPERKFYPWESGGSWIEEKEEMIESSRAESYFYRSGLSSNLSDFSLYDFQFDLRDEKKYCPVLVPAELDDYTVDLFREDIDRMSTLMVPQKSTDKLHTKEGYFGSLLGTEGIPANLLEIPEGIWKAEIYNDRLQGNVKYNGDLIWLDYDIATRFSDDFEDIVKPSIQIYFGPQYDTQIEGESAKTAFSRNLYKLRYFNPDQSQLEYPEFKNQLTFKEYKQSYLNEVKSNKLLVLSYSDNKQLRIDFIKPSRNASKNPLRNRNKVSQRMDDYRNLTGEPFICHNNMCTDKRSGVLLGNLPLDLEKDMPLFNNLLNKNLGYSSHTLGVKEALVDGKLMRSGKSSGAYVNPMLSPSWSIKKQIPDDFIKVFISKNSGGNLSNSGTTYVRRGSDLLIEETPDLGYILDENSITPNNFTRGERGTYIFSSQSLHDNMRISFKFIEAKYKLSLSFQCDHDYTQGGDCTFQTEDQIYEVLPIYLNGVRYLGDAQSSLEVSPLGEFLLFLDFDKSPYRLITILDSQGKKIDLSQPLSLKNLNPDSIQYNISLSARIEVKDPVLRILAFDGIQIKDHSLEVSYNDSRTIEFYSEVPCKVVVLGVRTETIQVLNPEDLGNGRYCFTLSEIKEDYIINIDKI